MPRQLASEAEPRPAPPEGSARLGLCISYRAPQHKFRVTSFLHDIRSAFVQSVQKDTQAESSSLHVMRSMRCNLLNNGQVSGHQPLKDNASSTNQHKVRYPKYDGTNMHLLSHAVETFRRGYPRLAAYMNSDRDFITFRYFGRLHARILLQKQDEITELEERLDELDNAESMGHYLCSRRHDGNSIRQDILREAELKLEAYNKLLQSYYGYVERARPERTSTQSVCNWMDGNKPLISGESSFLSDWDDLCAPSQPSDQGGLDRLLEQCAFLLRRRGHSWLWCSEKDGSKSKDRFVFTSSPERIQAMSRFLSTLLAVLALTVPIIALYKVRAMASRLCIVSLFTAAFSSALCWLTHSRNYEIFSATAAYCAVMVVFVGSIPENV